MTSELTASTPAAGSPPKLRTLSYVVITPVRNEANCFRETIASFLRQSLRPARWVIVDDGSTDGTSEIIAGAVAAHPWMTSVRRKDRGSRRPGTGVIEAFKEGMAAIEDDGWDFLVKFDGDLAFSPTYFADCLKRFQDNPKLGIGGGLVCRKDGETLVAESAGDPAFHVRGATKIYRKACWQQIGGLIQAPGWDTVDELTANMLGWETETFTDLKIHQMKDTGSADGNWRNWVKNGLANYVTGYHPLFMAAKCAKRVLQRPYVIGAAGLGWGYLKGVLTRAWRVENPALIRYVRTQQMNRLRHRPSLWDKSLRDLAAL